jgi:rhodanese-related sulfurtransferase
MSFLNSVRALFGGKPAAQERPAPPPPEPEPEEDQAPELSVEKLMAALAGPRPPLILDVREPWEWSRVHIPATESREVLHIPMNSLPGRLGELPPDREIAVMCAHGNRSYGVTHYLIEQGRTARNLTGGIARWAAAGGDTARS